MPNLSLREAATAASVSKSTILRAIQSGRLSAARTEDGGYAIQPAELFRVWAPKDGATVLQRSEERSVGQDAPAASTAGATGGTLLDRDLVVANVKLEAELEAMRQLLDAERRRADEIRADRDRWAAQAERLALAPPVSGTTSTSTPRPWWRRLAG